MRLTTKHQWYNAHQDYDEHQPMINRGPNVIVVETVRPYQIVYFRPNVHKLIKVLYKHIVGRILQSYD